MSVNRNVTVPRGRSRTPLVCDVRRAESTESESASDEVAEAGVAYAVTGLGDAFDRELLSVFDACSRPSRTDIRAGSVDVAEHYSLSTDRRSSTAT